MRVGLVVETHTPPPEVGLVVGCGVTKGIEWTDVKVSELLRADLGGCRKELDRLRDVSHLSTACTSQDRRMTHHRAGNNTVREEVIRKALREDDDAVRARWEVLLHGGAHWLLFVQALGNRHDGKGEAVGGEEIFRHPGQPDGHLKKHPAARTTPRGQEHGKDRAQTNHDDEGIRCHGSQRVFVEALPLLIQHATVECLSEHLGKLMRVF
mmetsp:Transcript_83244/g.193360  ORF Transcript_83244/g.193360 Transcript_83244/m.193360 type:complete len:210 (+) Transcript_83244:1694-2323(+)